MAKPNPKATMRCGETRKSTRPGKKIMHLYCLKGGKKKLVHAGSTGYARTRAKRAIKLRLTNPPL